MVRGIIPRASRQGVLTSDLPRSPSTPLGPSDILGLGSRAEPPPSGGASSPLQVAAWARAASKAEQSFGPIVGGKDLDMGFEGFLTEDFVTERRADSFPSA
eukprot:CAMPEP_0195011310 /NCGR_PEP_ID=MMETSP0326_2-20130528/10857_1 /TAXON_ID=2866 ORGANISM="Crypthecodinium cohnii, Strain Seligo" /NCGR_SAMPLE_ID=MMETSP0326_2 /ASSEMBLY_ACC=CAM_ASM_000348 /LENGTH=100 /DNA_ID=CAMNT_0040020385 /DNA_START=653 /DNA_END=953 /DNA_ORIENTATION=-